MCGIFGVISSEYVNRKDLLYLGITSKRRGRDSSGVVSFSKKSGYIGVRADETIDKTLRSADLNNVSFIMGHSRLITDGLTDNQPVYRDNVCVIHNGIILNTSEIWDKLGLRPQQSIDTEVLAAIANTYACETNGAEAIVNALDKYCKGSVSCAIAIPHKGWLILYTNTGSLYYGHKNDQVYFHSESYPLKKLHCYNIQKLERFKLYDIPVSSNKVKFTARNTRRYNMIPSLEVDSQKSRFLEFNLPDLRRCSKCILPSTMPFIVFDDSGVCNYCNNYKAKNYANGRKRFTEILESVQLSSGNGCIFPFSGGRDSTYALHLLVEKFNIRPVTMTYDWGMVTDLARRNVSRMCSRLGVENIIVADNIERKRLNIKKNLVAWLAKPHLGMLNILMAGDKHFFRHIETLKQELGTNLNIWGMNPLEVTHFKAGFLGFPPDFNHKQVFYTGLKNQFHYQFLRAKQFVDNPRYLNLSLYDTFSGEFYRSIQPKIGFHNIFDYVSWKEDDVEHVLDLYDWERALDTTTSWRIGDGTAAFYNYVYYTVAGFSEFDTFRSNQIREGHITREKALEFVRTENKPRYSNIKWYLDTLELDFTEIVSRVNSLPKVYETY